jgi:hypothetical protein
MHATVGYPTNGHPVEITPAVCIEPFLCYILHISSTGIFNLPNDFTEGFYTLTIISCLRMELLET